MICEYLIKFKENDNINTYIQKFSNNNRLKDYLKIKFWHLRIVCKHLENNKYLILGVIDKQETWGLRDYERVVSRYRKGVYDGDIAVNNEYYNNIVKKLLKSGRKGK